MKRSWWDRVIGELQTEGYGPLYGDSHEIVFKTWQAGGHLMVNKDVGRWTRVLVDVGGYRRRREESLEGLAQRIAYRVVQSHRPVTLEPMPSNERRVIHMVLRDNPDVFTESSGEGEARKVTILPRVRGR